MSSEEPPSQPEQQRRLWVKALLVAVGAVVFFLALALLPRLYPF